jgi:outer membrane receptor for ferrienterochelin and colicin
VLEKAPGVNIDSNDNISMRGKANLLVQIDGKNTPMTGTDLANYLRGIPSSSVEKIEFITNPSSKYDAAGTSIINISSKKISEKVPTEVFLRLSEPENILKTTTVSASTTETKKVNLFANYSFAYREFYNKLILDRNFYENGTFKNAYVQDNF